MQVSKKINLKTISPTIYLLFILCVASYGQNNSTPTGAASQAKKDDVILVESRTLLVELYGDPDIDENVKELVDKLWKFNQNIHYASKEIVAGILKNNESKYAVLAVDMVHAVNDGYTNDFFRFSVKLGEKHNKTKPVFFQDVPFSLENKKTILAKRDIIFVVNYIQNHFYARKEGKTRMGLFYSELKENLGKLENKTLLIDRKLMDKKLIENEIAANYTFPYKMADEKEIEKAILTNDKRYAYIEIVPIGGGYDVMMHCIIDCENARIISRGDIFNGAFDMSFSNLVNEKQLKAYIKNSKK